MGEWLVGGVLQVGRRDTPRRIIIINLGFRTGVAVWLSGFDAQERSVTGRLSDDGCWAGLFKLVGGALHGG